MEHINHTLQEEIKMENKRELDVMQPDKVFGVDGNEELCHCTGYEVQDEDGWWWNEYKDRNDDLHYGR